MNPSVWDTVFSQGRSFTPTTNAAVDISWEPMQIQIGQTGTVSFYISLGSGQPPAPAVLVALAEKAGLSTQPTTPAPAAEPVASTPAATERIARAPAATERVARAPAPAREAAPTPARATAVDYSGSGGEGVFVFPPTPTHDKPGYENIMPPSAVLQNTYQGQTPTKKAPIDMDYALDLYDRIQKLSSGSGGINGVNREEIKKLNEELDEFLGQLGRK
jgi:hypothetical protein